MALYTIFTEGCTYIINVKLTWIGYVHRFIHNNPKMDPQAYGRWWTIAMNEYPNLNTSNRESNFKQKEIAKDKNKNKSGDASGAQFIQS